MCKVCNIYHVELFIWGRWKVTYFWNAARERPGAVGTPLSLLSLVPAGQSVPALSLEPCSREEVTQMRNRDVFRDPEKGKAGSWFLNGPRDKMRAFIRWEVREAVSHPRKAEFLARWAAHLLPKVAWIAIGGSVHTLATWALAKLMQHGYGEGLYEAPVFQGWRG